MNTVLEVDCIPISHSQRNSNVTITEAMRVESDQRVRIIQRIIVGLNSPDMSNFIEA